MKRYARPLALASLISACAGGDSLEADGAHPQTALPGSDGAEAAEVTAPDVVHAFERDGSQYEVVSVGDDLVLTGEGPSRTVAPHARLSSDAGGLTTLELVVALAPTNLAVDERLIDQHASEARELGRADETLARVSVKEPPVVDKAFNDCELNAVGALQFPTPNGWGFDANTTWGQNQFQGGVWSKNEPIVAAVCNEGDESLTRMLCYRYDGATPYCWPSSQLSVGAHRWVRMPQTSTKKSVYVVVSYYGTGYVPISGAWGIEY